MAKTDNAPQLGRKTRQRLRKATKTAKAEDNTLPCYNYSDMCRCG